MRISSRTGFSLLGFGLLHLAKINRLKLVLPVWRKGGAR
jgi:hypothetical protein